VIVTPGAATTDGRAIDIAQATRDDEPVLAGLAELYQYDFTEFTSEDVGDDGRFGSAFLARYWAEPDRYAFIARVGGKLAGFALVRRGSELGVEPLPWDMVEFFVMKKYRRHGVGRAMAFTLFDRFRGPWQVREIAPNAPAQAFWRRIIREYTDGRFDERRYDEDAWRGPVQFFESSP
jgi:predicted acetyltransferase